MIKGLVHEREYTQQAAIREVSDKWSHDQTITGPVVSIPYFRYVKEINTENGTEKIVEIKEHIHLLPEELIIDGSMLPEKRHRGIYDIVVYSSKLMLVGRFNTQYIKDLDIVPNNIQWDKAHLTVGITDLRGIRDQVLLRWNNDIETFNPGMLTRDVMNSGIHAPVALQPGDSSDYQFSLELNLKGSQFLHFIPAGKVTEINLNSPWPDPKFNGAFLPEDRSVGEDGFKAYWKVLHLNRNFPQVWTGGKEQLAESAFGVDLLLPVDNYQKSYRSINYAILFIGLTFLTFFFIEVLNKVFIHPIQYILVGIALVVFYSLLLSISEQMPFNAAFIVSAIATLVLIATYVNSILKSKQLTFLISGILLILYSFIFVVIQLQDFALLIGSIGIFIILALVMYYSRKIDWYAMKLGDDKVADAP
jgi:inner membrane protein